MLPSERLFLDRDLVFGNRRARQRAIWLYEQVRFQASLAPELGGTPGLSEPPRPRPFPKFGADPERNIEAWHSLAEVAESYPRLLIWLTEGQVSRLRNVFGFWVAIMRLIPGLRWLLWRLMFKPVAARAPWWPALYEIFLQKERSGRNQKLRAEEGKAADRGFGKTLTIPAGGTPGLSAISEVAVITQIHVRDILRGKVAGMAAGCIGISGLRGSGKTTQIRDFCSHRYGTRPASRSMGR